MGEQSNDEIYLLGTESFENSDLSFIALTMLDGFIEHCSHSPYYKRAEKIISEMRKFAKQQLDAEAEHETFETFLKLGYKGSAMRISDSSEKQNKAHSDLIRLLVELQPLLDELEKCPPSENASPTKGRNKFPLKYKNNTFSYGQKSVSLKDTLSFACFCHYFYTNCPASGKLKFSKALLDMNVTDDKLRQWIKDFNRWAQKATTFSSQINSKGKLLKVSEGYIQRLK